MIAKLDYHIARRFLARYFLVLFCILGLYVVIDTIDRLSDFSKQPTFPEMLRVAGTYYLSHVPPIFVKFANAISLVAGVWTLVELVNQNELMAMQISGVSSQRSLLSLVLATLLPSIAIWAAQERFGPSLLPPYRQTEKIVRSRDHLSPIRDIVVRDTKARTFFIGVYLPGQERLEDVWILPDEQGQETLHADRAEVIPGGFSLKEVASYLAGPKSLRQAVRPSMEIQTSVNTQLLHRRWLVPEFLARSELKDLRDKLEGWPERNLLAAEYYRRFTDPVETWALLLLCIPIVVSWSTEVRGLGIPWWLKKLVEYLLPLLVFSAFFVIKVVAARFLPPVWAAWVPQVFLSVVGLWAFLYSRF